MKKAIFFLGDHPRHLYVLKNVVEIFEKVEVVIMKREKFMPVMPNNLADIDKKNFKKHFRDRKVIEKKYFGNININKDFNGINISLVKPENFNSKKICDLVKIFNPDLAFVFGTDIIKSPLIDLLPKNKINLHLGLSPWYKGAATLFWPFYHLLPQFSGVTFHQITSIPDAGEIIHQSCPRLYREDGIHDVSVRCVINAATDAKKIFKKFYIEKDLKGKKQISSGRVWRSNDFQIQHLRIIYNLFNNDIVKHFLEKKLSKAKPNLFSSL